LGQKLGPARLRLLDAEMTMSAPDKVLSALAPHFNIAIDAEGIAAGPAFARHSKSGASYSAEDRRVEYAAARASYGEEIATVLRWAEQVAETAGVDLAPPEQFRLCQA
jgi:hypothetical protein